MLAPIRLALLATLAAALAHGPSLAQGKEKKPSDAGTIDASGRYLPSEAEQKFDCKKLNGRLQVRIMQLRAELTDPTQPSGASQVMQQVTNPALKLMYGGASPYGTDRAAQLGRDRAQLEAYNGLLAAKSCPIYDLAAELRKKQSDPPPAPVRPASTPAKK